MSRGFFAAAGLLIVAPAAFSYHLFYLQSGAPYVPTKWTTTPNFTVGSSTGATDITPEVTTAASQWKNIATAKSPLGTFTAVPAGTIYNGANFGTAWGILAIHQFGDHVGDIALGADVVHRHDVGMSERGHGAGFLREALAAGGIASELGRQGFQGHVAGQAGIACAIHLAHAPGAQRREDFVRAQSRAGS
jgi:hypothetical protein